MGYVLSPAFSDSRTAGNKDVYTRQDAYKYYWKELKIQEELEKQSVSCTEKMCIRDRYPTEWLGVP